MSQGPDSANDRKRRTPADHIAVKHDAIRSDAVQALVRNILIVAATDGETRLLISSLRAALGRHVEARTAIGLPAADRAVAGQAPQIILVRHTRALGSSAGAVVQRWKATIFAPVILVCDPLDAREVAALREARPLDVIARDDLDSVRLFEALLKAVNGDAEGRLNP